MNSNGIGFEYTTKSGTTISARDIEVPKIKPKLMSRGDEDIAILQNQFNKGLITEEEYESAGHRCVDAHD